MLFSNVVYNSYAYEVEVTGFIPEEQAFLVSNETELLDVKLTPNAVDIDKFEPRERNKNANIFLLKFKPKIRAIKKQTYTKAY